MMAERNQGVPERRRMRFRIGINLGDVIHDETRIYGDGINIAARLEALADPGGVLVSSTVHDQVRGKLPLAFEDLGEHQVKNIAQPVHVYRVRSSGTSPAPAPAAARAATGARRWLLLGVGLLVVALGAAGAWWWLRGPLGDGPEPPRLSIVVLPFRNLSGDPGQEYVADAVTEDLTSDVSRLAGSFVISRNTAFTFKGRAVDVRQIGRELGVRYALEGSVRRMGRTVRVNAQLADTRTGAHLWAEQLDLDHGTLDTSGIAGRLARMLSVELVNVEGRRAPRTDPDATDLTLRGWSILNGGPGEADTREAIALLEAAVRIDPANSQARVGLAQALTLVYRNRWDPDLAGVLTRADGAVDPGDRRVAGLRPGALREGRGARPVEPVRRRARDVRARDRARPQPRGCPRGARPEPGRERPGHGGAGPRRTRDPPEPARSRPVRVVLRPLPREHAPRA